MSLSPPDPADRPRPALLAGLADGELPPRARRRAADWVADDPAAAEELRRQRSLSPRCRRFWRAAAPPEPTEATWAGVFARIEAAMTPRSATLAAWPWRFSTRLAALAATAAVIALVVGAPPRPVPDLSAIPSPVEGVQTTRGAFPLMDSNDVDVLSLRPADAVVLLVGGMPLPDEFELASAADVTLFPPPAAPPAGDAQPGPMILPGPRGE